MGPEVRLIDSGAEVADFARRMLIPAQGQGKTRYFVSDDPECFRSLASLFLHGEIADEVGRVDIAKY